LNQEQIESIEHIYEIIPDNTEITPAEWTINWARWTINWACDNKYDKAFKKREREIKNTKIYTGSPFLKDYVQSFANKQRVTLKRSPRSALK